MDCFVLGSGGMMPMPRRRLTSVALRHEGEVYLFDCGEGTQVPYKELHLGQRALRLMAITHLHADHVLGLPGMLMLRAQMPEPAPLTILGPPGLETFISNVRRDLAMYINYPIQVKAWEAGGDEVAYEDEHVRVLWRKLNHSVLCLGYRVEQHQRPGRFDPQKALDLEVPKGPLWGNLQRGEEVETPGGEVVRPDQVLGPARRGLHVAFVTDTAPCPGLDSQLQGVDLAFVEGMFLSEHAEEGAQKKHLTVEQAAQAASRAGAREMVLVHLSPRYVESDLERVAEEAGRHHGNVVVGRDGMAFTRLAPDE